MSRALPDWVQGYLVYTAENEAPEPFHTWTALSVIGGVLRRRVFFDFAYFLLFPNLYIILVAPAGRCKKSTAMRIGRNILSSISDVSFTTDSVTRERLIQDLAQSKKDNQSAMTAYSSEFASLLTSSGMDMVVFLTDIYDCPLEWTHRTKMGGTNTIEQPFLNLLGGTTPQWISRSMPLDTVGIGLTSRIIFVYQNTPRIKDAIPKLSESQKQVAELLKLDLLRIAEIRGEYRMDSEAFGFYNDWYKRQLQGEGRLNDTRLAGYFERKPYHMVKTAMCLSAARRDELVITLQELKDALGLLQTTEADMPKVFSSVGKNPLAEDIDTMLDMIENHADGLNYETIATTFKHSLRKEEIDEVLEMLQLMGRMKAEQTTNGPVYRKVQGA